MRHASASIPAHGGDHAFFERLSGRSRADILDFSVNVNPDGMPAFVRAAVHRAVEGIEAYPEPWAESACAAAAALHGLRASRIVFGNGSNQLIHALPASLAMTRAVVCGPAFSEYAKACALADVAVSHAHGQEDHGFAPRAMEAVEGAPRGAAVFLANPANPAGTAVPPAELLAAAARRPDVWLVVDEAFADYAPECSLLADAAAPWPPNLVVLRSLTKFYGMAGLRAGYLVADPDVAAAVRRRIPEWSVGSMAAAAARAALDGGAAFRQKAREANAARRSALAAALARLPGVAALPSAANYLLLRVPMDSGLLFERLLRRHAIAVRDCANFVGLEAGRHIRVAVRGESDNALLADAMAAELEPSRAPAAVRRRRTPAVMLQGVSSNAGKSVLAAAFGRILLQEGFRAAPFKAQNMALNSFVTRDGGEIGRAQAVQAAACRVEPDPRMNPILLKPNCDTGSQVVLMGKPVANMDVRAYFEFKRGVFPTVAAAYDSLAADHDAIVIEGAGSPAEVNLKDDDIVNMRMARHAGSPVLLVGDIDRGGVYGSFIGDAATFDPWERALLMGFIVNKFRGDASLLASAHDYVRAFTGRPVLGVVPYLRDIGLPEEDMASLPFDDASAKETPFLDIAVVVPRHVSNFTDFAPLAIEPDVQLRLVRAAREFGNPDAVALPGSKNVIGSLRGLREDGLDSLVVQAARSGKWIVGVCGGLQICGGEIADPHAIESPSARSDRGLGLIDLRTTLEPEKTLRRSSDVAGPFGMSISGYEIHHGRTVPGPGVAVSMRRPDGEPVGFQSGRVWTTYLHGVFDDDLFRRRFLDMLRQDKGLPPKGAPTAVYSVEASLNRLADVVRASVDMDAILRRMGLR